MLPVAFHGLCATLHPASGRRGALILGSMGFDDLCGHRFLRGLAEDLASRGIPALRLDLRGTGDSAPADDLGLVDRWADDVALAMDVLRQEAHCTEVTLIGFRLGALVAAHALGRGISVERLALLAPPSSGKAYLHELKVLSRVINAPATSNSSIGLDLAGFQMSDSLLEQIASLTLDPITRQPPAETMLCATGPLILVQRLAEAGCDVTDLPFEGYDRLMCDPTASIVPGKTAQAVAKWVANLAPPAPRRLPHPMSLGQIEGEGWRETGLVFGTNGALNGILCQPSSARGGPVVLFTNAGGIRRTGWGNSWVDMARMLARTGVTSLRFDFSNLQVDLAEDAPAFHYGETIWSEVSAAMDALEDRHLGPFVVAGACSGSYHGMRVAALDERISAAILVNQLCYEWSPAHALPFNAWVAQKSGDFDRKRRAIDEDLSELARMRARLMVTGIKLAKTSAKTALRRLRAIADLLPIGQEGGKGSAERIFQELSARGCKVHIVQAEGDASVTEFEGQFGPGGERILALPGISRVMVTNADHLMTPLHARDSILACILEAVEHRLPKDRQLTQSA